MSKSVASEFPKGHESRKMSRERGSEDEGDENGDGILDTSTTQNPPTSTTVFAVPATTDQFMFTEDFKRLLVGFVMGDTSWTLRLATKAWKRVVDAFIDDGVESGAMIVRGEGKSRFPPDTMEIKLTVRVIFLLNITKVGENACAFAENLVVVDIPEGIQSIGWCAFYYCISLTTVSFPTTLVAIEYLAFNYCKSLDSVDPLHTNLQKLGQGALSSCSELKSMTIPDSLQTLGKNVFWGCDKLVPSSIDLREYDDDGENVPDATPAVIVHLRSQQRTQKMLAERDATIVEQAAENEALTTENAAQATEIAVLKER